MKKVLVLLMAALIVHTSRSTQTNPFENVVEKRNCFLDAAYDAQDEYSHQESQSGGKIDVGIINDNHLYTEEYDQYVSDSAKPTPISPTQAMLAKVLGNLIYHYITVREITHIYLNEVKQWFSHWYSILLNK